MAGSLPVPHLPLLSLFCLPARHAGDVGRAWQPGHGVSTLCQSLHGATPAVLSLCLAGVCVSVCWGGGRGWCLGTLLCLLLSPHPLRKPARAASGHQPPPWHRIPISWTVPPSRMLSLLQDRSKESLDLTQPSRPSADDIIKVCPAPPDFHR